MLYAHAVSSQSESHWQLKCSRKYAFEEEEICRCHRHHFDNVHNLYLAKGTYEGKRDKQPEVSRLCVKSLGDFSVCIPKLYNRNWPSYCTYFYPLLCVVEAIPHAARLRICASFHSFVFLCFQHSVSSLLYVCISYIFYRNPKYAMKNCDQHQKIIIIIIDKTKFGKKGFERFVHCVRRVFAC